MGEPRSHDANERRLTHVDDRGRVRMVDVSRKPLTPRVAVAKCIVTTTIGTANILALLQQGDDVIESARFAGFLAAKQTSRLIPLCHPIHITEVVIDVVVQPLHFAISARTEIVERTGVEMEALAACAMAALALISSFVEIDPMAAMEELTLWHKSGGKSGTWERMGQDQRMTHRGSA